jgi:DnaJ-domain-containing protein 1
MKNEEIRLLKGQETRLARELNSKKVDSEGNDESRDVLRELDSRK